MVVALAVVRRMPPVAGNRGHRTAWPATMPSCVARKRFTYRPAQGRRTPRSVQSGMLRLLTFGCTFLIENLINVSLFLIRYGFRYGFRCGFRYGLWGHARIGLWNAANGASVGSDTYSGLLPLFPGSRTQHDRTMKCTAWCKANTRSKAWPCVAGSAYGRSTAASMILRAWRGMHRRSRIGIQL